MVSFLMQDCEIRFVGRQNLMETHIYIYIMENYGHFVFWVLSMISTVCDGLSLEA